MAVGEVVVDRKRAEVLALGVFLPPVMHLIQGYSQDSNIDDFISWSRIIMWFRV